MLLQVFDRLSLWLCKGDPAGTGAMDIALPDGRLIVTPTDGGCSLSPYPFASDPVTVTVPVRVVPLTGDANGADAAAQILSAHVEERAYAITSQSPLL